MAGDLGDNRKIQTVGRVHGDTIIELVYDRDKRQTALVVSRFDGLWNIEREVTIATGESLVPYSARNNLIAHDCVLLPSKPEPFGSKAELLTEIERFLHRYVAFSPAFERLAAHYILLSWLYDAFSEVPYLRLRGDLGTGKTRGLIVLGSLCYRAFFAAGASTVSPIFHTLDRFGGTLILDEADFRFSDATADLVKIFNNGTVKGVPVLRTVVNRQKEFNPAAFRVFGPKIVAMRGSFADEALESRFFTEETGTNILREDIPLHLPPNFHDEALSLRNRLLQFRLSTFFSTKLDTSALAQDLDPRLNQIAAPLVSMVDDAGVRGSMHAMLRDQQSMAAERRRRTLAGQILRAALEAIAAAPNGFVPVQAVADAFNRNAASEFRISARRAGAVLHAAFGVPTHKSHGAFVFPVSERLRLQGFCRRYGLHDEDRHSSQAHPETL